MTDTLTRFVSVRIPRGVRAEIELFARIWCAQRPAVRELAGGGVSLGVPAIEAPAIRDAIKAMRLVRARVRAARADMGNGYTRERSTEITAALFALEHPGLELWGIKAKHWSAAGGAQRWANLPPNTEADFRWRAGWAEPKARAKRPKRIGRSPDGNAQTAESECLV